MLLHICEIRSLDQRTDMLFRKSRIRYVKPINIKSVPNSTLLLSVLTYLTIGRLCLLTGPIVGQSNTHLDRLTGNRSTVKSKLDRGINTNTYLFRKLKKVLFTGLYLQTLITLNGGKRRIK